MATAILYYDIIKLYIYICKNIDTINTIEHPPHYMTIGEDPCLCGTAGKLLAAAEMRPSWLPWQVAALRLRHARHSHPE